MKMDIPENTALIIVDVQKGFDDPKYGERNNPFAEQIIEKTLTLWRKLKRPVVHIQHSSTEKDSPLRPDQPGFQFKPESMPTEGEPVFRKSVHSAFIGTGLEAYLRENGIKILVICGLTTDQCVSTTTRMAGNLGFKVYLVGDASATFSKLGPSGRKYTAEEIHDVHLASIDGEFCKVIKSEDIFT